MPWKKCSNCRTEYHTRGQRKNPRCLFCSGELKWLACSYCGAKVVASPAKDHVRCGCETIVVYDFGCLPLTNAQGERIDATNEDMEKL